MKFVDEAKRWWRMACVWAMSAAGALQATWMALPDDMKATIDHRIVAGATIALLVLAFVGRMVDQDIGNTGPKP